MTRPWSSWWWQRLRVRQKLWGVLLLIFIPLVASIIAQITLLNHVRALQQQHQHIILAREQIEILRRLTVDIEDAFRGYLLTRQVAFLAPLREAEPKVKPTIEQVQALIRDVPNVGVDVSQAARQLMGLLESKHVLIEQVQQGKIRQVLRYVESGRGIALSDSLRNEFRALEDRLDAHLLTLAGDEAWLTRLALWGLMFAIGTAIALGVIGVHLIARSITRPLAALEASATALGTEAESESLLQAMAIRSSDEIGQLARAYRTMAQRIRQHIHELETIIAIGHDINTIGADGLSGVLRRITDSAALLLKADVCLVMSRDEKMGCWIVEAASGEWHDRLHQSVMLWEEFPVSVTAFETRQPAIGEDLRQDERPEVVRRNRIGESMLSIPLLSQGSPFGVLVLLTEGKVPRSFWNLGLARGFADEAAIAIANARLLETAQQRGKGLEVRLRQFEHLAETLAHDLKAPGERVQGLVEMLSRAYVSSFDARGLRWLALLEQNAKELTERVHDILALARVGAGAEAVEAVDPAVVLRDILKQEAGTLEARRVRLHVQDEFPLVACHRAYLRQVFDNLMSNAIKYAGQGAQPEISITAVRQRDRVWFAVYDNGPGIPKSQRERVFQPFIRLNPEQTKGSGIGLTIVRRIIELYGGEVWIESAEGEGCRVAFTLPALGALAHETAPVAAPEHSRSPSTEEFSSVSRVKKILPALRRVHQRLAQKTDDAQAADPSAPLDAGRKGGSPHG
jgi:signal transduction histidine kinase/CHASE3 domain sensor protein